MLKIKDGIDLKELEKFGLKPKYSEDTGKIIAYEKIEMKTDFSGLFVTIKETKSKIRFFKSLRKCKEVWAINKYHDYFDVDTLYDLIKADIVDKMEE